MNETFKKAIEDGASDIHIKAGDYVRARLHGNLVPTVDGEGRVVAAEIMRVTGTIRDCILDSDRLDKIHDLIADGKEQYGSQTFDQHLMHLVSPGMITFEVGKGAVNSPSDFDLKMNILGGPGRGHAGGVSGGDPNAMFS